MMAFYEHITVLPNSKVKCTLCKDIIEDGDLLKVHIHGEKHKELYMKNLMKTNGISISVTKLFCDICNCIIEVSGLTNHVRSQDHQIKLTSIRELVSSDGDLIELPGESSENTPHCTACDKHVKFTYNMIKDHINSYTHRYVWSMVAQPLNGIFSVEGNDKLLWCKICQIYFDNFVETILRHVKETDHAKKIAKILRLIDGQNVDINKYLQDLREHKAYCRKCKIEVPCNVDNLQSHVKGKQHRS